MSHKNFGMIIFFLIVFSFSVSACAAKNDVPARTVEMYYGALVNKDESRLLNLTCADWEVSALLEFDSFANVSTELVDFECQTVTEDNDNAKVQCSGFISASYGEEIREFSLGDNVFNVINEFGEWRMCGYE